MKKQEYLTPDMALAIIRVNTRILSNSSNNESYNKSQQQWSGANGWE